MKKHFFSFVLLNLMVALVLFSCTKEPEIVNSNPTVSYADSFVGNWHQETLVLAPGVGQIVPVPGFSDTLLREGSDVVISKLNSSSIQVNYGFGFYDTFYIVKDTGISLSPANLAISEVPLDSLNSIGIEPDSLEGSISIVFTNPPAGSIINSRNFQFKANSKLKISITKNNLSVKILYPSNEIGQIILGFLATENTFNSQTGIGYGFFPVSPVITQKFTKL